MSRPKVKMSLELFEKVVDNAIEAGINKLNLNVYNEPLLDSQLFDRISYAKSRGMCVGFFTNGTLLTREKAKQILESGLDRIIFSVDSVSKETYERIRIGANFDDVVRNTQQLVELRKASHSKKPFVRVYCVVQKDNYAELTSQRRRFQQVFKGVDAINFGVEDERLDSSNKLSLSLQVRARPKNIYPCPRLWFELVVLSSGKVALCCLDFDGSVELGDLNTQTIQEVWESPKFRNIRQLHLKRQGRAIELCSKCPVLYEMGAYSWWKLRGS